MKKLLLFGLLSLASPSDATNHDYLLPLPQTMQQGERTFHFKNLRVSAPDNCKSIVAGFLREFKITETSKGPDWLSVELVDSIPGVKLNPSESYTLEVSKRRIVIKAVTPTGVYRAFSTLRQLREGDRFQEASIVDWPAFRVRGFMQDVGRSYISLEELKREIDILSHYKINLFHWHLTENQAWRLESKIFPMLNDSVNMTRMPGRYYTLEEARDLVEYCRERHVMLLPEIDMPGHSEAFRRTFRHDMQSPEGMKILKLLVDEVCETFDVPYLHIGTDEVEFHNPGFVSEMVEHIRSKGKKVISWNPGWNYKPGEIDMMQLWSSRGKARPGIPAIDSRLHYLNHFDTFADIRALYNSTVYGHANGSEDLAGTILALWHDRVVDSEEQIILQNNFYPNMLAIAERAWMGGGFEYFDKNGTNLLKPGTEEYEAFADFEKRMLRHKQDYFYNLPFGYVKQTNVQWHITDPFPNDGDLSRTFPPEEKLEGYYDYKGITYGEKPAYGAAVYLRHVWGTLIPGFYDAPRENHTAYAYTYVYSPIEQETGLWVEFQNYSRSESDLPPLPGTWDYKGSRIWLNDEEIAPPQWSATHRVRSNEIPLGNENFLSRPPIPVNLQKGWNKVLLKLPVGRFSTQEVRLQKWMFTTVFVTLDGSKAVDGLIYSPQKIK